MLVIIHGIYPVPVNVIIDPEPCVVGLEEDGEPEDRVDLALKCLPHFDAASSWTGDSPTSFRYWKIRDYAYAYRSKLATPSMVSFQLWILFLYYFSSIVKKTHSLHIGCRALHLSHGRVQQ